MIINNCEYRLIKNYKDAFEEQQFLDKCTDYFYDYDYVVGDIAYGMLRLKGFYKSNNKKVNKINNYNNINKYLTDNCASDCKYFIVEKCKINK